MFPKLLLLILLTHSPPFLIGVKGEELKLGIKMYDFSFVYPEENNDIMLEFIGMDVIKNGGSSDIVQTISHRKVYTETYDFVYSKSTEYAIGFDVDIKTNFSVKGSDIKLDIQAAASFEWGSKEGETKSMKRELEVVSSRQIIVPPMESVQACSAMQSNANFTYSYTARARHFVEGMDIGKFKAEIEKYPYTEVVTESDSIVVGMEGALSGNFATSTKFFVTPHVEGGGGGSSSCEDLKRILNEANYLRRAGEYHGDDKDRLEGQLHLFMKNVRSPRKFAPERNVRPVIAAPAEQLKASTQPVVQVIRQEIKRLV